nr:immunoglobulin heavy chain junction region [Macaca mulatta]MOW75272.1 immunoglobulin heavy chain junction region [Macaca mulatta]MOW76115.1 immunoglobulin heavy chain junction region [Macaca mulatta]MOW76374.1 immunoglobulin heavy chain junction region [Macaca mulatta]MOW77026.1 immunoglobulin heavy chain junction region [Macaca mulatta]
CARVEYCSDIDCFALWFDVW